MTISQQHSIPFQPTELSLPGKDKLWLQQIRQQALTYFTRYGFPTTRQEDWKYTKVTPISQQLYQLPTAIQASSVDVAAYLIGNLDSYPFIFVNGCYQPALSRTENIPASIILCDLATALMQHESLMQNYLAKISNIEKHGLQAMNTAYMQTGYFLHIPANVQLANPLQVLFLSTEQNHPVTYQLHNLLIAETASQATVIEHYLGLDTQNYWTNTITEVHVADAAKIDHIKIQQESEQAYHTGTLSVRQKAHSHFNSYSYAMGGRLVRSDTDVLQTAEYANCQLNGLYLAKGKQHIDHHTSIDHAHAHGSSRELYKGIISEQGRAVFNGKVIVRQDAQKIDAAQTNNNLLLSEQAEINTKPELEIYADDVRCAHGATVGQLNKDELFYLRSRGLSEVTARSILTFAFANELLEILNIEAVRSYLRQRVLQQLAQDPTLWEVL